MDTELALSKNEFVVFDFEGVDFISHSFADECFGKLLLTIKLSELKQKTTFKKMRMNLQRNQLHLHYRKG